MEFFKKLKNNKGFAEPLFFCIGLFFLIIIILFITNMVGITGQRFEAKKVNQNISRVYAIRWTEGITETGDMATDSLPPYKRQPAEDIQDMIKNLIKEGNLTKVYLHISTSSNISVARADPVLCIMGYAQDDGMVWFTANTGWEKDRILDNITYGTTLYSHLSIHYENKILPSISGGENDYTITNKFASEQFGRSNFY